jgi:FOG: Ankyrin repeat
MKKLIIILGILAFIASSCGQPNTKKNVEEQTTEISEVEPQLIEATETVVEEETTEIPDVYPQLIKAIETDDKSAFDKLINHIPNIDSLIKKNRNDNYFYTLLGFACKYKRCHFAEQLINLNADIETGESDEYSICDALSIAVASQDMCLVKLLLNNGANPNRWNSETGCTVLSISCRLNNYDISKLLIESGAKVDGVGDTGFGYINYPLLHAIGSNNIKLVQLLIDNNCTIDINDNQGDTPFTIAERNENQEILDLLKKAQEEN